MALVISAATYLAKPHQSHAREYEHQRANGVATVPLAYAMAMPLTLTYIPATHMKAPARIVSTARVVWTGLLRQA